MFFCQSSFCIRAFVACIHLSFLLSIANTWLLLLDCTISYVTKAFSFFAFLERAIVACGKCFTEDQHGQQLEQTGDDLCFVSVTGKDQNKQHLGFSLTELTLTFIARPSALSVMSVKFLLVHIHFMLCCASCFILKSLTPVSVPDSFSSRQNPILSHLLADCPAHLHSNSPRYLLYFSLFIVVNSLHFLVVVAAFVAF